MSNTCKLTQTCHSPLTLSQVIPPAVNLKQNWYSLVPLWGICHFRNSHRKVYLFKKSICLKSVKEISFKFVIFLSDLAFQVSISLLKSSSTFLLI